MRTVHTYKFDSIDEIVDYLSGPCRLSPDKYDLEAITHEGFCKMVYRAAENTRDFSHEMNRPHSSRYSGSVCHTMRYAGKAVDCHHAVGV